MGAEGSTLMRLYNRISRIILGIAIAGMLLFLFVGQIVMPDEREIVSTDSQVFETTWEQVLQDGTKIPAQVPGKNKAEAGEVVTLITTLPQTIKEEHVLCFHTVWQDVEIYIDGKLRESYTTKDSRPFGRNSVSWYLFVDLEESDAGKELTYCFSSDSKYAGTMRTCYIGDRASMWMFLITKSGTRTLTAVFIVLMGLASIIVCFVLRCIYRRVFPLTYLAWTVFLCGAWILSETEIRQLVLKNISVLSSCTYWSLMLIPIAIIMYMSQIQEHRYDKLYFIPNCYAIIVLLVATTLQILDVVQFVQSLSFIHIGLGMSIVCIIVTILLDFIKKKVADYAAVAIGVCGMLFAAVLEMILYYLDVGLSLGTVLGIGMLFLLVMAIIKTAQEFFQTEQKKQQAIVAKEAQAKFLANMSHEIRTPINAVVGMNEMILRENKDDTIQEYANNIQRASSMLLGLVNDILDFTKIESGQLELVEDSYELSSLLLDETLMLNARVSGKPISVKLDIDPRIPSKLFGDELRIKQILNNILSNAVKYTTEGSVIFRVGFKWIDEENLLLKFIVKDTGVGIKKEDMPKLFDGFKRLELSKNRHIEGTGLGLNIAKQLVDLMQGTIEVESEYGKGSVFTIVIPQMIRDREPIGDFEEVMQEQKRKKTVQENYFVAPEAKILAVDDNSMNLSVTKGLLKRTLVNLDVATSGRECLELTKHKKYDIILMDHMMPELDGVQTLNLLRGDMGNVNHDTIVIALTANAIADSRQIYLEYGFNDYISKPIQMERMEEILCEYLPKEMVHRFGEIEEKQEVLSMTEEMTEELLCIEKEVGMSYCLDSEEFYLEVLEAFCEQCRENLPLLEACFVTQNWKQYGVLVHGVKSNSLNIGAVAFSKLSLQHELAGKEENVTFILAEYENYINLLEKLLEKVETMIMGKK